MTKQNKNETNHPFYTQEKIQQRLKEHQVDIQDISLSDLLSSERTNLADKRNVLALKRNAQSGERTYSAWVRTGFSIVSAGIAFSGWLSKSDEHLLSNIIGSILVTVGLMSFSYVWFGYYKMYNWLKANATKEQKEGIPHKLDFIIISLVTVMLLIASITAYIIVIFS